MKILHLIDSGGLYGAEQMLLALTEEQISQGLQPIILSCGLPDEPDKPIELEAQQRGIPVKKWRMKAGLNVEGAWQILNFAKEEKIDILHSHGYKFNILMALFPKFIRKIPVVSTVHGYVFAKKYSSMWVNQLLDKIALKFVDMICLVSPAMTEIKAFSNIKKDKIKVIFNGIASNVPKQEYYDLIPNKKVKCLAIGRLVHEKDFSTLIKAFKLLKAEHTDISLNIMGEGPLKSELSKEIDSLELGGIISLDGFVNNPAKYFDNFDVLILSSTTEGVPITILEAMRGSLPVISTNVGGIPWMLKGKNNQLLFEPKKTSLLVRAIQGLLALNKTELNQLIYTNKVNFEQSFSAPVMAKKYLDTYINLDMK